MSLVIQIDPHTRYAALGVLETTSTLLLNMNHRLRKYVSTPIYVIVPVGSLFDAVLPGACFVSLGTANLEIPVQVDAQEHHG